MADVLTVALVQSADLCGVSQLMWLFFGYITPQLMSICDYISELLMFGFDSNKQFSQWHYRISEPQNSYLSLIRDWYRKQSPFNRQFDVIVEWYDTND